MNCLLYIPSIADIAAVKPNGPNTFLANGIGTFINGLTNLLNNLPKLLIFLFELYLTLYQLPNYY